MPLRILSAADLCELLTPQACMEAMGRALAALSAGSVTAPLRSITSLAGEAGVFGAMPCAAPGEIGFGAKLVSLLPGNPAQGRAAIQGLFILYDPLTGAPAAVIDGAELTALRTAAVSGLASRLLADPHARSHGVLGAGRQAAAHITALMTACPGIAEIRVWSRTPDKARAFAQQQTAHVGATVIACDDPRDVASCDIVTAATGARTPILRGDWVRAGAHVNLIGAHSPTAREADTPLMQKASIYVDTRQGVLAEAGDVLIPIDEGAITAADIAGEIGALVSGPRRAIAQGRDITVFKSVGHAAQDLWAARLAFDRAICAGLGAVVDL